MGLHALECGIQMHLLSAVHIRTPEIHLHTIITYKVAELVPIK